MAHVAVWASSCGSMALLRAVEHAPCRCDQHEAGADEHETENVKRPEMRVGLPAEHHLEEMSGIVRKPIHVGIAALQPSREEIDGEREAVHLGEQRHQEGAERAERSPVAARPWLEEAVGEQDEHDGVYEDESPQAIGWRFGGHGAVLSR